MANMSGASHGCCYCCSRLNMDRVPGLTGSAACHSCNCCCYRSRSIEIGINILYNESKISCWPYFTRFRFCVEPISRDFVFVLTRFHEISFLCWSDFTMLIRFHEIYSRKHRNFDFCYNLAPQYTASLYVLYVSAAEYSGRCHTGTRLSLSICCSKRLVMTQHSSTSLNHIESPWWCKHAN